MAYQPEILFISRVETGLAVSRTCRLCKFGHTRRKPGPMMAGKVGRGNGMREGNKQRGLLDDDKRVAMLTGGLSQMMALAPPEPPPPEPSVDDED